MPIPEPTGQDARIEDLEIIATGDYSQIVARKDELVKERASISDTESEEYKDLTARIDTLDAAAKKAKKDKGCARSDDDLAYWSGRVANASTNAFSASVNGVSVGISGWVVSLGILSTSAFVWTYSASTNAVDVKALENDMTGIKNHLNALKTAVTTVNSQTNVAEIGVASTAQLTKALLGIVGVTFKT